MLSYVFLAFLFSSFLFHLAKTHKWKIQTSSKAGVERVVGTRQKPSCFRPRGWLLPHVR